MGKFIDGLIFKKRRDNAPEFIKGHISIKREALRDWLSKETDEWINADLKLSKEDKLYIQVNEWKKPQNTENDQKWAEVGEKLKNPPQGSTEPTDVPLDSTPF